MIWALLSRCSSAEIVGDHSYTEGRTTGPDWNIRNNELGSDGDIVIVKMGRIINNVWLVVAIQIQRFVDDDISGEVLRLGENFIASIELFKYIKRMSDYMESMVEYSCPV